MPRAFKWAYHWLWALAAAGVGLTDATVWSSISSSQPQVSIAIGTEDVIYSNESFVIAQCNATWYKTDTPEALGVCHGCQRARRVIDSRNARLSASSPPANRCSLARRPWDLSWGSGTDLWRASGARHCWSTGPGQPSSDWWVGSRDLSREGPSGGALDRNMDAKRKFLGSPALSAAIPALVSPQQRPAHLGHDSQDQAFSLPTRAAEPWTVEQWLAILNPEERFYGYSQAPLAYVTTPTRASGGYRIGYAPQQYAPWSGSSFGLNYADSGIQRRDMCVMVTLALCPRSIYSPSNTTWSTTIEGDDVCRQLTVWPPKQSYPPDRFTLQQAGGIDSGQKGDNSTHAARNLDSFHAPWFPMPPLKTIPMLVCSTGTIDRRQRPSAQASRPTPQWWQTVTTVYPPGTVAVLPTINDTEVEGDYPGYSWRVNRAHVVSLNVNTPSSDVFGRGDRSGRLFDCHRRVVQGPDRVLYKTIGLVLLDDPWCVGARNCTPDVGGATWMSKPNLADMLEEYGTSDAVKGVIPRMRLGCALAYDIDLEEWNVDLLPADLPASQNTRALLVGGSTRMQSTKDLKPGKPILYPADRGRYNIPSNTPQEVRNNYSSALGLRKSTGICIPVDGDMGLQVREPVLTGPFAVYRGAVTSRIYPPPTDVSLPRVQGGKWVCHRSSLLGTFAGRAVCVATCDDPGFLPIDSSLEAEYRPSFGDAWQLVASTARIWYGEWLGYPVLEQSGSVLQLQRLRRGPAVAPIVAGDGASTAVQENWPRYKYGGQVELPSMVCSGELRPGFHRSVLGFRSKWAQREVVGRAELTFDLVFDRNTWLPAQVAGDFHPVSEAPGLAYPNPSRAQLDWLEADLLDDFRDIAGDTEDSRTWKVAVERVIANPSIIVNAGGNAPWNSSLCVPPNPLPMRVSVRVTLFPHTKTVGIDGADFDGGRRSMSAGAVAQQLVATFRGQRQGSKAGTWLLAVDGLSVGMEVQLPCLQVAGGGYSTTCEREWRQVLGSKEKIFEQVLLFLSILAAAVATCAHPYPAHQSSMLAPRSRLDEPCSDIDTAVSPTRSFSGVFGGSVQSIRRQSGSDSPSSVGEFPQVVGPRLKSQEFGTNGIIRVCATSPVGERAGFQQGFSSRVAQMESQAQQTLFACTLSKLASAFGTNSDSPIPRNDVFVCGAFASGVNSLLRVVWMWVLVVEFAATECSIPAAVLGVGLLVLILVRALLMYIGLDLIGLAWGIRLRRRAQLSGGAFACFCIPCIDQPATGEVATFADSIDFSGGPIFAPTSGIKIDKRCLPHAVRLKQSDALGGAPIGPYYRKEQRSSFETNPARQIVDVSAESGSELEQTEKRSQQQLRTGRTPSLPDSFGSWHGPSNVTLNGKLCLEEPQVDPQRASDSCCVARPHPVALPSPGSCNSCGSVADSMDSCTSSSREFAGIAGLAATGASDVDVVVGHIGGKSVTATATSPQVSQTTVKRRTCHGSYESKLSKLSSQAPLMRQEDLGTKCDSSNAIDTSGPSDRAACCDTRPDTNPSRLLATRWKAMEHGSLDRSSGEEDVPLDWLQAATPASKGALAVGRDEGSYGPGLTTAANSQYSSGMREARTSSGTKIDGILRLLLNRPALCAALRALSVLAWDIQACAAWLAYRDRDSGSQQALRTPLLDFSAKPIGESVRDTVESTPFGAQQLQEGREPQQLPTQFPEVVDERHGESAQINAQANANSRDHPTGTVRGVVQAAEKLEQNLRQLGNQGRWLRLLEDLLVLGVCGWVVACVLGLCGWKSCSLTAAQIVAGGDDEHLVRSAIVKGGRMAVYGLDSALVGMQRVQILAIAFPVVSLYVTASLLGLVLTGCRGY